MLLAKLAFLLRALDLITQIMDFAADTSHWTQEIGALKN